jgi:hypothetical protein
LNVDELNGRLIVGENRAQLELDKPLFIPLIHSWAQSVMDRYLWYQSIISIVTFDLIFINVIDPSVKDLLIFDS